jgi:hypothetical protein
MLGQSRPTANKVEFFLKIFSRGRQLDLAYPRGECIKIGTYARGDLLLPGFTSLESSISH